MLEQADEGEKREATVERSPSRAMKEVRINGREWTAKIDSEAEISVVSEEAAKALELELVPSTVKNIRGVGGACSPIGQATVLLEMDELTFEEVVLTVLPSGKLYDKGILLGKDVVDSGVVTIFYEGTAWMLKKEVFPRIQSLLPRAEKKKVTLKAKAEVKIQPRTVCFIQAEPIEKGNNFIRFENNDKLEAIYDIRNDEILIPVANLGSQEINVNTGAIVARAREIDPEREEYFSLTRKEVKSIQVKEEENESPTRIEMEDLVVNEEIPDTWEEGLLDVVNSYRSVVATTMKELGRASGTEFEIEEIPGSSPVRSKPFRLSLTEREALREILR